MHSFPVGMIKSKLTKQGSLNPFTPPSSASSMESESRDILEASVSLEEGLRRSQLKGLKSVEKKFGEVESIYRQIHGEAASQQDIITHAEDNTLKTALLTGEAVEEVKRAKKRKDRRLRMKILCVVIFISILVVWLGLVYFLHRRP